MTRVLVVDDSATARALLVEILRSDPAIQVVGEAKDGAEALELTQQLRPDLVTMDVRMPRLDGFAATKEIMIAAPTPIVIVTASFEDREIDLAMRAPPGAARYCAPQAARSRVAGLQGRRSQPHRHRQGDGPGQGGAPLRRAGKDQGRRTTDKTSR